MTRLTFARIRPVGRVQRYRYGGRGEELWVVVQISLDAYPRVGLAWASNVRWIRILESIKAEVSTAITIVLQDGEIFNVELWDSVEAHRYKVFVEGKGEEVRIARMWRWKEVGGSGGKSLSEGLLYFTRVQSFGWPSR